MNADSLGRHVGRPALTTSKIIAFINISLSIRCIYSFISISSFIYKWFVYCFYFWVLLFVNLIFPMNFAKRTDIFFLPLLSTCESNVTEATIGIKTRKQSDTISLLSVFISLSHLVKSTSLKGQSWLNVYKRIRGREMWAEIKLCHW